MWESGALVFLMEKHCLVCVYQWAFSFVLLQFFSKCLTDVALFLFFFSVYYFSLVNSVWPKLQDVWWISYAKTHHHHWTKYNVNGHSATISFPSLHLSSPPPPFLSRARPRPAWRHPQSPPWPRHRKHPVFIIIFANEVFCAWSADHLFTEGRRKKTKNIATDSYAPYRNRPFPHRVPLSG